MMEVFECQDIIVLTKDSNWDDRMPDILSLAAQVPGCFITRYRFDTATNTGIALDFVATQHDMARIQAGRKSDDGS